MNDASKYMAELIGTFALVLFGCGSAVIGNSMGAPLGHLGYLGIALAFGLTLMVLVYTIGNISGCHVNPAVTISMLVARKISFKNAVLYVLMQCLGAIAAALLLFAVAKGKADYNILTNGLGQNGYGSGSPGGYSLLSCFVAEVVLTALFLIVIFGATSKNAPAGFAGIAIGISLAVIHIFGIPVTGTSVNPARSLGPALVAGGEALSQLWLFLIAPVIGGVIAALIWKYVFEHEQEA